MGVHIDEARRYHETSRIDQSVTLCQFQVIANICDTLAHHPNVTLKSGFTSAVNYGGIFDQQARCRRQLKVVLMTSLTSDSPKTSTRTEHNATREERATMITSELP